ncbi:hypothetical protein VCRA2123O444_100076 [Vibrio crassostreae]|uniref:hypothetical protein n=1 Tax=Vibrio crassostreae TaxID=246167 RepID=UPI001049EFCF|nr:hypothetical protein [Vibrio crassostreae]TCN66900.1 hypothetical protein EDB60_11091 [Vibrio crassostreae]CAK1696978.1 hypothetical protein VCRA2119O431_100075 [Vibrio crassostreae]CAK1700396.1 hypothetical protein VCRA2114O422_100080 [Vibrio crassostreae]CAK1718130.1 hypothetical protein VCRA2119O430_110080 [Vibrio crassostreae]CAK1718857.1 hypothetical protein VCRA2113O409_110080 [Vibrio crassostreae]
MKKSLIPMPLIMLIWGGCYSTPKKAPVPNCRIYNAEFNELKDELSETIGVKNSKGFDKVDESLIPKHGSEIKGIYGRVLHNKYHFTKYARVKDAYPRHGKAIVHPTNRDPKADLEKLEKSKQIITRMVTSKERQLKAARFV